MGRRHRSSRLGWSVSGADSHHNVGHSAIRDAAPRIMVRCSLYLIAFIIPVIIFGYRDFTVGTDTVRYVWHFERLSQMTYEGVLSAYSGSDVVFYLISKAVTDSVGIRGTFVFFATLLAGALLYFSRTVSPRRSVLLLGLYAVLPVYYNFGTNIIKHGAAVSLLIIGLAFLWRKNYIACLLFFTTALLLHTSAIVFLLACFIALFVSSRWLLITFVLAAVGSSLGYGFGQLESLVGIDAIGMLAGDRFGDYITGTIGASYNTGFRLDFVAYTAAPVALVIATTHGALKAPIWGGSAGPLILRVYLAIGTMFFLSFFYPYSDRIGAYAWILIPALVGLPGWMRPRTGIQAIVWAVGLCLIVVSGLWLLFQ